MKNLLLFFVLCFSFVQSQFEIYENFVSAESEEAIQGSYIVVLKDDLFTLDAIPGFNDSYVHARYDSVLGGYNLRGVPDDFMVRVLKSGYVEAVYQDAKVYAIPVAEGDAARATQVIGSNGPWGLDRIDQRTGLDGFFNYDGTGSGVTIFIADGGVLSTHTEFTGRYLSCTDYTGEGCSASSRHGTHVAGTALGTTYGVAKGASLVDLKVLKSTGTGSYSSVISAINDVATLKRANPSAKYVLNASLGGGFFEPLNTALAALVATGVTVVVAAGNQITDACSRSPSSEPSVVTVGSTTRTDARSYFSNFGTCVDVFAPGSDILSATNTGNSDTAILSGTSMASPHVAGIAAVMLELGFNPMVDLVNLATPNVVADPGTGSPNRMVFLPKAQVPVTPSPTKGPTKSPTTSPTTRSTTPAPSLRPSPVPTQSPTTLAPTTLAPMPTTAPPTVFDCFDWIQGYFSSVTGVLSGLEKTDSP